MKFSADDVHVWTQQALCLEAAGRHVKALEVLTQVIYMQPSAVVPCLLAARICYQHLFKVCFINNILCENNIFIYKISFNLDERRIKLESGSS